MIEGVPTLLFQGKLINDLGNPVANAFVQFWQTDPNGQYHHPRSGSTNLDTTFQYFGTATTEQDGSFVFKTHRPGIYRPRPTHIHFKVWVDGNDVLTSQFYFSDENTFYSDLLQLDLKEQQEIDENDQSVSSMLVTEKTIIINQNLGGVGPFTPQQTAGPFYPIHDFFTADNDLTNNTYIHIDPSSSPSSSGTPSPTTTVVADDDLTPTTDNSSSSPSSASSVNTTIHWITLIILSIGLVNVIQDV